jgi:dienelactone hydrolase
MWRSFVHTSEKPDDAAQIKCIASPVRTHVNCALSMGIRLTIRSLLPALTAAVLFGCAHLGTRSDRALRRAHGDAVPTGIAAYSQHAKYGMAKISPKGTYLAIITVDNGISSLEILNLAAHKSSARITPGSNAMPGRFAWVNDKRVVMELLNPDGDLALPVSNGEICAVNADGSGGRFIFGYRAGEMQTGSRIRKAERDYAWANILAVPQNDDRHVIILVTLMQELGDRFAEIYKLDAYTGIKDHIVRSPIPRAYFLADETGEPRIASGFDTDYRRRSYYRDGHGSWRDISSLRGFSPQSVPLNFVASNREVDVTDDADGAVGLFAVNIDSGERKLLARNDIVEPTDLYISVSTRSVLAVEYEPDVPFYEFLDLNHPLVRALQGLLKVYPDEQVRLVNTTADEKKALDLVYSDRDPGRYLVIDADTLKAEEILSVRPWIRPEMMNEMSAFHIPASDGLQMHGYITLPRATTPRTLPPLVVLPHGGPHGIRDSWGFDAEAQMLASEGFAVLQVNYRGSGGYGRKYEEAGYRHWGDRVIQDIVDATRFAIRKGFADPKRVCIYGASFGGYAALQAAIVAPDLFRCAAGYAGVYDLSLMNNLGDIAESVRGRAYVKKALGENADDERSASPVYNASKITAKVFLIHGKKDWRAPFEHAERMRDALTAIGRPPQWLVESDEGHGFYDEDARQRMYTQLVAFLKENTQPQ